jgi:hypothetical protein
MMPLTTLPASSLLLVLPLRYAIAFRRTVALSM